jgi:hypothetical protein
LAETVTAYVTVTKGENNKVHGTAFVYSTDKQHMLTCNHLVMDAVSITVTFSGESPISVKIKAAIPSYEIAILELPNPRTHSLLRGASYAKAGSNIFIAGFTGAGVNKKLCLTKGICSRDISVKSIYHETDTKAAPGNSGGPVLGKILFTNDYLLYRLCWSLGWSIGWWT